MFRTAMILLVAIFFADTFAQILNCTRENEEYRCGSACQTTCSNLNELCPIMNFRCNDACYCKPGYARVTHANSSCVPVESCPKQEK